MQSIPTSFPTKHCPPMALPAWRSMSHSSFISTAMRGKDPKLGEFFGYMEKLRNYEKSGIDTGTDSDDGFELRRMRRLLKRLDVLSVASDFTSDVKLKSISIVGGADGTSPSKMRAFINRDDIDFSDAQTMQPVQEWELAENMEGFLEYQTRYSRFQSVGNLTLHFPDNFGGDTTQIYYIGLRGEATQLKRDVVATIVYELMPNPSDHKTRTDGGGLSHVE